MSEVKNGTLRGKISRPLLNRLRSFSDPKSLKKTNSCMTLSPTPMETDQTLSPRKHLPKPKKMKKEKSLSKSKDINVPTKVIDQVDIYQLDEASTLDDHNNYQEEEEYWNGGCPSDDEYDLVDEDGDQVGSPTSSKGKFKKNIYKWVSITFSGLSMGGIGMDPSSLSPRITAQNQFTSQRRRSAVEI
ncbi:hypothetical protein DLAC_04262 [Tieghemostelium lacteum]|uniref:Uncharacterized protein n=1 Tax=Tieghemostelium lacteum TaxID=361077 RepID=A0A151ZSD4_TIELA|nr:hypothetical protein DLAC_04262 [Tieghemostelium lacteum]|eukprot:KYQ96941.1 hypothetical protein DLAC_04262 [Tieghemostelium lacteum]